MASPTAKTDTSLGVAPTSMLQPSNASQAGGLIATTAAPVLAALGSPHASNRLSVSSRSAFRSQADVKVSSSIDTPFAKGTAASASAMAVAQTRTISELKAKIRELTFLKNRSEIAVLVELGESADTVDFSKKETNLLIADKINALRNNAEDFINLTSVRSDLCKLSRISSKHYANLKEEVFNLLIRIMENDPIAQYTADGILEIVIDLNNDLIAPNAQLLTIKFQRKLVKAFSAAVELYLRHYSMKHVNAVVEERKKALLDTTGSFTKLNRQDDLDIEYATEMAMQASRRFTSDLTAFREFFQRFIHCATAAGKAYNKDASGFFSEIVEAFQGLEHKFKGEWFDALFMLRNQVQKAPDSIQKVIAIQTLLATKKTSYDWKFIYGAFEILGEVISSTQDIKALAAALFGEAPTGIDTAAAESLGLAKETVALSAAAAQSIAPRLSGIVEFLEFNGYVTKAFKATDADRKADRAVQTKAKELCTVIIERLSASKEGLLMIDPNLAKVKTVLQILGNTIPTKLKNPTLDLETHVARTPLMLAAQNGYLDVCEALLKAGANPLATDRQGSNVLHQAVCDGKVKIVQLFAANKQLINSKTKRGCTPLMLAAQDGDQVVSQVLLKAGADLLAMDEDGLNAIHYAAREGKTAIISMLSVHKSLIDSRAKNGSTPLMFAAQSGHLEVCKLLLAAGADQLATNETGWSAMHWAADAGKTEIVQLFSVHKQLICSNANDGCTPLMFAAYGGHVGAYEALLKVGADPLATNKNGSSAMHFAAWTGKAEIIARLLPHTQLIDIKNKNGKTALLLAAQYSHVKVCELLLKAGADPLAMNENGFNAMHYASREGNTEIVQMLLAHKQLIDLPFKDGRTPLLLAAEQGQLEVCKLLLKAGANPLATDIDGCNAVHYSAGAGKAEIFVGYKQLLDSKDKNGCTPLLFAARQGHLEACKSILDAGANPLATNEDGQTALHIVAYYGKTEIVRLLAAFKQLINSKAKDNFIPLMVAAHQGHLEACEILLKAGANALATNEDGINAMHLAASEGKAEIVQYLSKIKQLVDSKSWNDRTPLMLAAAEGHLEVCLELVKADANPLMKDMIGYTAMHHAAQSGKTAIVQMLFPYRQLIDLKCKKGATPLMLAAKEGHPLVCEALLAVGANQNATNGEGKNAMQLAEAAGKTEVLKLLSAYMKQSDAKK